MRRIDQGELSERLMSVSEKMRYSGREQKLARASHLAGKKEIRDQDRNTTNRLIYVVKSLRGHRRSYAENPRRAGTHRCTYNALWLTQASDDLCCAGCKHQVAVSSDIGMTQTTPHRTPQPCRRAQTHNALWLTQAPDELCCAGCKHQYAESSDTGMTQTIPHRESQPYQYV